MDGVRVCAIAEIYRSAGGSTLRCTAGKCGRLPEWQLIQLPIDNTSLRGRFMTEGDTSGAKYNSAGTGGATGRDFWQPGTPVYNYAIAINGSSLRVNGSGWAVAPTVTDTSSGSINSATIIGQPFAGLQFTRTVSFGDNDQVIRIEDTIANSSGGTLTQVATLDNTDPDQDSPPTSSTQNDVVSAVVTNDFAVAAGDATGLTLGFGSPSSLRVVNCSGFSNTDPYPIIASPNDPNGAPGDIGLDIAFNYGTLANGESRTVTWYMVFNPTKAGAIAAYQGASGCGNGDLDAGEECDDHNTANGDGCSATCQVEPCWACGGAPSACELATNIHTVASLGNVGRDASVAIGSDGLPVISYYDVGAADLKVAHCNDAACSSSTITTVDSGGDVGKCTSIAIGGDGLPLIAYYDATNQREKIAHCGDDGCVTFALITRNNVGASASSCYPGRRLGIGTDGFGVLSYVVVSGGGSTHRVAHCTNATCSAAGDTAIASGANFPGTSSSGAVVGDGRFLMASRVAATDDLIMSHCTDVACTSFATNAIDTAVAGVSYSAVAVGSDGLGLVSYDDDTNGDLKVAHCSNATCSSATLTTVDNPANSVGLYSSIAIGAGGLGVVSHYDSTAGDLRVTRCANTACTSAMSRTIDSGGDVGQYTSIADDGGGQLLIAYYDVTNGDLKTAACGPSCGDGNKTPDEQCDDGDTTSGDGCSASCTVETCWNCSGDPSVCTPKSSGSSCPSDGLFCDGTESCNGSGSCVSSGNPCSGGSECNALCNEAADNCFDPNGTPCADEPNPCTVDQCNGAGSCGHLAGNAGASCRPAAGACDAAEVCDGVSTTCPANGFQMSGTPCGNPLADACTDPDSCDGVGTCQSNDAGSGTLCPDDGNPCTTDQCDGGGSCAHPAGNAGALCRPDAGECDVADHCTGVSSACPPNAFEPSGTACTDDGNLCTDDECNGSGSCQHPNNSNPCDDHSVCTQADQCSGGSCVGSNPLNCSDSNPCTQDSCDATAGCANDPAPASNCVTAAKSRLLLKQHGGAGDSLLFKWVNGGALTAAELGDPTATTEYALCIYKGPSNEVLFGATIPASATSWAPISNKGYKYRDILAANGIGKVILKGNSTQNKSKALVKGRGSNLPDPILGNLPLPITLQLVNPDTGICIGATFDSNITKNTATQFKAKAP